MTGKLSAKVVKTRKGPGRIGDDGGLWLQVRDATHKSWLFRYRLSGKARAMGLGPVEDVGLAEARDLAREYRRLLRSGVDPINRRKAELAAARSASGRRFRDLAAACIEMREAA